ncbi:MAG: hypothetical protein R8K22_07070 [Mariprofundaceae bacterium]
MSAIWEMPWFWRVWVGALMLVNGVLPWFYIHTLEAQVVLAAFMLAAMTQMILFRKLGFVRLLGLGHIYWVPMLGWLLFQDYSSEVNMPYITWLFALMLFNSMSVLIDIVDLVRYYRGEKQAQ